MKHFCHKYGYKLSPLANQSFKKASDYTVKDITKNAAVLNKKADAALENLMTLRSPAKVFQGIDLSSIQSPLSKALAIIFNGSAGKEQALAYVAHYVLTESKFFKGSLRRSKLLAGRLLRQLASARTPLSDIGQRLRRRLNSHQLGAIKQELYRLSKDSEKAMTSFGRSSGEIATSQAGRDATAPANGNIPAGGIGHNGNGQPGAGNGQQQGPRNGMNGQQGWSTSASEPSE